MLEPNLDALRRFGISLDRHYTARFCAPTRGMVMTGRYPWKLGLQTDANLNPAASIRCAVAQDSEFLPAVLKRQGGYSTHAFGKWHLGSYKASVMPTKRGFDSFTGFYSGGLDSKPEGPVNNTFFNTRCACPPRSSGNPQGICRVYPPSPSYRCT